MDGIHDLGGRQGFGKVPHVANSISYKPEFHEDWEHLAYTLATAAAMMDAFSIDELRHAIERMSPRHYFSSPYYDRINTATASLLVGLGYITQKELDEALAWPFELARPYTSTGRPAPARPNSAPYEVGDMVMVRDEHVHGHIRVPGYCRGKRGTILHRSTQTWPFPDTIGHGDRTAVHQPSYHVEFTTQELWGDAADAGSVVVDLYEGYLIKLDAKGDLASGATIA